MITIAPNIKVHVHTGIVDFRKGIDGLSGVCKYELKKDPFSGAMFIFSNRSKKCLKILYYDGQGFWVYHKRLSTGRFKWWPNGKLCKEIAAKDLCVLIWNGDPRSSKMQQDWRPLQE